METLTNSSVHTTIYKISQLNDMFLSRGLSTAAQHRRLANAAAYYTSNLEGYMKSAEVLERRVQDFSDYLANALTLTNQARMLQLNNASAEDNTNVFAVTMVTMVYLPASFVSTFLGMNLFDFNDSKHDDFTVSSKFWIFFAAAVPLTCLTLGFWYLLTKHRQQAKQQPKEVS
ncbi:hypothetical protein BJX70DRAFT_395660 [Aspergillus crustosus]